MGVGQIISDTFGTVRARLGQMLGLWALYLGITILLWFVFGIGMMAVGMSGFAGLAEGNPFAMSGGLIVFVVLFYIGYLVVALAQYASLIQMASPIERPTFGEALGNGWKSAPALLLLMIVLILGYIAVAMVFSVLGAALASLGEVAAGLLLLLLLPALIWLGCRLAPLFAVVAVDGVRNPFTAIARSWRLTGGHALTIFLAMLVFVVILVLVCGIALLPSIGLLVNMADPEGFAGAEASAGSAVGGVLLFMAGMLVASVLFNLLYCAFLAVIHGTLVGAAGEGVSETFA